MSGKGCCGHDVRKIQKLGGSLDMRLSPSTSLLARIQRMESLTALFVSAEA